MNNRGGLHFLLPVFISISLHSICMGEEFTLQKCFELAQQNNEIVRAQAEKYTQASERVRQSKGALIPDVRFRYRRFLQDASKGVVAADNIESKFSLSQPLFYGFRKVNTVKFYSSEKRREEFQSKSVINQLKKDVAQAFFTIVQIESDRKNLDGMYNLMTERMKELNERVRLGKSRESEVLAVESSIAIIRAEIERTNGTYSGAVESLALLIGKASDEIKIVDETATEKRDSRSVKSRESSPEQQGKTESVDEFEKAAMERSDVQSLRENVSSNLWALKIAKGDLLPTLDLTGSWYTSRSGSLTGIRTLAGVDWDVLLYLDVPIFQGGIKRSRVTEASSIYRESQEMVNLLIRTVKNEVRTLHKLLASSISQADALKEAYEKAEKSYQLQKEEYRLGLVNNLDVLQSMTTFLEVKRNYDRALIQVKLNRLLLDITIERI